MTTPLTGESLTTQSYTSHPGLLPDELALLLSAAPGPERDSAWATFVERHSRLLLRVSQRFGPGYDDTMDRYLYMLEELRRDEFRRLRKFTPTGGAAFTGWLAVVARRLCLDHYRRRYGRTRGARRGGLPESRQQAGRLVRRRLADLTSAHDQWDFAALATAPDESGHLCVTEERRAVERAVAELSPEDRRLLSLRFEQDLTARKIAALLGFPTPFHVYRRLRSVCEVLHGRLQRTGVAEQ